MKLDLSLFCRRWVCLCPFKARNHSPGLLIDLNVVCASYRRRAAGCLEQTGLFAASSVLMKTYSTVYTPSHQSCVGVYTQLLVLYSFLFQICIGIKRLVSKSTGKRSRQKESHPISSCFCTVQPLTSCSVFHAAPTVTPSGETLTRSFPSLDLSQVPSILSNWSVC